MTIKATTDCPIAASSSLPIALVFYPQKKDAAFNLDHEQTGKRIRILQRSYDVRTFEVETMEKAAAYAQEVLGRGKCAYLELAGHGTQRSFAFDENVSGGVYSLDSRDPKVEEQLKILLGCVQDDGVILIQSCKNGSTTEKRGNILQRIGKFANKDQRIFGTIGGTRQYLTIGSKEGRHFRFVDSEDHDLTRIFQMTVNGAISINAEQAERLIWILGNSLKSIELSYQILSSIDFPNELSRIMKQHPKIPETVICHFENLTILKPKGTVWGNMLNDLESLRVQMGWNGERELKIQTSEHTFNVREKENGTLIVPNYKKLHTYKFVYLFILALSAIDEYSSILIALDNGKKYFKNPAAKALYALTGQVPHFSSVPARKQFAVLEAAKRSYALAKERGNLLQWFSTSFKGMCFDERCDSIFSSLGKRPDPICSISQSDTPQAIVHKAAEYYCRRVLSNLELSQEPKPGDDAYKIWEFNMSISAFEEFLKSEIEGRDLQQEVDQESIEELGVFIHVDHPPELSHFNSLQLCNYVNAYYIKYPHQFFLEQIFAIIRLCGKNATWFHEAFTFYGSDPEKARGVAEALSKAQSGLDFMTIAELFPKSSPAFVGEIANLCGKNTRACHQLSQIMVAAK